MSKLHQPRGRADADTAKGELRKPDDYSNQPGQAETAGPEDETAAGPGSDRATPPAVGESPREYAHGSGDRNTMRDARDFHQFEGGIQRDATPDAPLDPAKPPDRSPGKRGSSPARADRNP